MAKTATKPIIIADTDEIPAPWRFRHRGMLRAGAQSRKARRAGRNYDPQSAKAAHAAGVGATGHLALGGKSGIPGDAPSTRRASVVEKLSDGNFGPLYGGRDMEMGRSAALRIGDVGVVVFAQGAARRPINVSLCRHQADRAGHPGQQGLRVFPRRFRADRRAAVDLRSTRRPMPAPATVVDALTSWHPPRPKRPPSYPPSNHGHRMTTCPPSTASRTLPTNSPRSAAICTPIPRWA